LWIAAWDRALRKKIESTGHADSRRQSTPRRSYSMKTLGKLTSMQMAQPNR